MIVINTYRHRFTYYQILVLILLVFFFPKENLSQHLAPGRDSLIQEIETLQGRARLEKMVEFCGKYETVEPYKVLNIAKKGLKLATSLSHREAEFSLMLNTSAAFATLGEMDSAFLKIDSALLLAHKYQHPGFRARSLLYKSRYLIKEGSLVESRRISSAIIQLTDSLCMYKLCTDSRHILATSYLLTGDYQQAIELLDSTILYGKKYGIDITTSLANKAMAKKNLGKPAEALRTFFEVREIYLAEGEEEEAKIIEHHIAYLLNEQGLYDEALRYYIQLYSFFTFSGNVEQVSSICWGLGEITLALDSLEDAENYFQQGLYLKETNGIKTTGLILNGLGSVYMEKKNYSEAISYFNRALESFKETGNKKGQAIAFYKLADAHNQIKKFSKAQNYVEQALDFLIPNEIKRKTAEAYEILAESFGGQGKRNREKQAREKAEQVWKEVEGPKQMLAISKTLVFEALKESERLFGKEEGKKKEQINPNPLTSL
ncbi:MAG: tetratricopeptide repeat protein, partial [Bacteroidota bacterium]